MPHLKTETFKIKTEADVWHYPKVKISVNANGEFYANLESDVRISAEGVLKQQFIEGEKIKVIASSLNTLESLIEKIYRNHYEPKITEEPVILYNIESHVTFAEDKDGNIFPNAGYPNANWNMDYNRYGEHHAAKPSNGGYCLTIGAKAMMKTTYFYGDGKKVKYKPYYKGESHLGRDNPAQQLNNWAAFNLDYDTCKEMPYTDEAAEFFYSLLYSMAKISKMIQDNTFEQEKLLQLIATGSNPMLPYNNN